MDWFPGVGFILGLQPQGFSSILYKRNQQCSSDEIHEDGGLEGDPHNKANRDSALEKAGDPRIDDIASLHGSSPLISTQSTKRDVGPGGDWRHY